MSSSREQVERITECFNYFDRDCDGKISTKELGKFMRSLGEAPTEKDLNMYIEKYDYAKSGYFDLNQIFECMNDAASTRRDRPRLVLSAFNVLDSDHDGRVAAADLRHILMKIGDKLTPEEMNSAFAEVGITDDAQTLGIEEFYKITGTVGL